MSKTNPRHLEKEIQYFYHEIWGRDPDSITIERYINAHEKLNLIHDRKQQDMIDLILDRKLNAEAIEFFLRTKNQNNLLTRKWVILFFLSECISDNYERFFISRKASFRGWIRIVFALLHTATSYLRGWWLVRRYGLV